MAFSDLVVNITGNAQGLKKTLGGVTSGVRGFGSVAGKVSTGLKASFAGLATTVAPLLSAFAAFKGLSSAIGLAAEFESTAAAMGSLLGDMRKAEDLMSNIETFSASTPFGMSELSEAARGLLAFGRSSSEVMGDLQVLGDISAATNKPLQDFVDIFGKVRSTGKASMEEINRLAERGVPIYSALANTFKVGEGEVQKLVSAGKVGFPQLQAALQSTTAEGGKFSGGMAKQAKTLNGMWSTFKDNALLILKDIGGVLIDAFDFKGLLSEGTSMAQAFRSQWLPTIKGAITGVANVFKSVMGFLKTQWDNWGRETVKSIVFVAENWKLFAQVAWERLKLFASNSWERMKTFFVNVGELMSWLGDNWPTLLQDMTKFLLAATKNMAANMGEFFKGVMDFAKGKGFKPKFKSLTDGWQSSLKDLPKFTKASVQDSTAELDRLQGEVNKRAIEFEKRFQIGPTQSKTGPGFGLQNQLPDGGIKREDFAANTSIEAGTKEAFTKIFAAIGGQSDKKKPEKKTADNTAETVNLLEDLKRLWERLERKIGIDKVVDLSG